MDGHTLPFTDQFNAVFSNAALHWMKHPARVVASVWRAIKPDGRSGGEFGGDGTVTAIVAAEVRFTLHEQRTFSLTAPSLPPE